MSRKINITITVDADGAHTLCRQLQALADADMLSGLLVSLNAPPPVQTKDDHQPAGAPSDYDGSAEPHSAEADATAPSLSRSHRSRVRGGALRL